MGAARVSPLASGRRGERKKKEKEEAQVRARKGEREEEEFLQKGGKEAR